MSTRIVETTKYAPNERAWALGCELNGKFHIRRVVWGRLLARAEKRPDERVRRVLILVVGK